jgi:hypothetical protein
MAEAKRQFGNPDKGELPLLQAATKQHSEDHDWHRSSVCDNDL